MASQGGSPRWVERNSRTFAPVIVRHHPTSVHLMEIVRMIQPPAHPVRHSAQPVAARTPGGLLPGVPQGGTGALARGVTIGAGVMNWLADEQRRRNRLSQGAWQRFAAHRQRVTELLLPPQLGSQACLAVLGAGNCNDLDLPRLLGGYREIHLLDRDREALLFGLRQQQLTGSSQIHVHAAQDLTGILDSLAESEVSSHGQNARDLSRRLRETFVKSPAENLEVVASVCLMTQLIDSLAHCGRRDRGRPGRTGRGGATSAYETHALDAATGRSSGSDHGLRLERIVSRPSERV